MSPAETAILLAFFGGMALGALVHRTNFCTMGAVSDWVNIGDTGRFRAWMVAMAVALIGVQVLDAWPVGGASVLDIDRSLYRSPQLLWAGHLLGGLLFGIGMTLAGGCGNRNLVRLGGGNLKSLVVFLVFAVVAMATLEGLLAEYVRIPLTRATAIDLGEYGLAGQGMPALLGALSGVGVEPLRWALTLLIGGGVLVWAFRSPDFRRRPNNVAAGLGIGALILFGWWVTGFFGVGQAGPLIGVGPDAPGSYAFTAPLAYALRYLGLSGAGYGLTFGIAAVGGVVLGSFLWGWASGSLRWEVFRDARDFGIHLLGAVLMGLGGVLALGCTFGQGITGASTLALGSFLTLGAIILGAAVTMKVLFYRMLYEGEASLPRAVVAALADLRLLPGKWRSLAKP